MKKMFYLLLCLFFTIYSKSQDFTSGFSPTAASLGVYNEVPVSNFTGVPQIGVPICKLPVNSKYSIPVSISYHVRDVKPLTPPGILGLGWSLKVGGVISRKVNDDMDEREFRGTGFFHYGRKALKNIGDAWSSDSLLQKLGKNKGKNYDYASDEFIFNFLGKTGTFMMCPDGQFVLVEGDEPLKMSVSLDAKDMLNPASIVGDFYGDKNKAYREFKIVDSEGIKYVFGGEDAIELSTSMRANGYRDLIANSWFLREVTYPTGEKVSFEYERADLTATMYRYQSYSVEKGHDCSQKTIDPDVYAGQIIYSVYLKEITTPIAKLKLFYSKSNQLCYTYNDFKAFVEQVEEDNNNLINTSLTEKVNNYYIEKRSREHKNNSYGHKDAFYRLGDFEEIFRTLKLDSLKIFNSLSKSNGVENWKFSFIENSAERLKLSSVKKVSKDFAFQSQEWKFNYEEKNKMPQSYIENVGTDHWGYYNGSDLNNKETDTILCKAELLKEIIYPTKGSIEFFFENNDYSYFVNTDSITPQLEEKKGIAGGVRIYKIEKNYNSREKEIINYIYKGDRNESSGELSGLPIYYFSTDFTSEKAYAIGINKPLFFLSDNSMGSHVGYSKVTVISTGIGKEEYFYTNYSNGRMDASPVNQYNWTKTPNRYYNRHKGRRGKLLEHKIFSKEDVLNPQKITHYIYSDICKGSIKSIIEDYRTLCTTGPFVKIPAVFAIEYPTYSYLPIKKEQILYTSEGEVKSEYNYEYNGNKQLSKETFTTSSGEEVTKLYHYPQDMINHQKEELLPNAQALTDANIIGTPLLTEVIKNERGVSSNVVCYDYFGKKLLPSKILSAKGFVPKGDKGVILPDLMDKDLTYHSYDKHGNPQEVSKLDGSHTYYIWGYQGQYPIAKLENFTSDQAKSIQTLINRAVSKSNSETDRTINNEGQEGELRRILNLIRNHSSIKDKDIFVTTYTYDPLVGMTSMTDSRGKTIYYNYDLFNRLIQEKDSYGNVLKFYKYNYKNE